MKGKISQGKKPKTEKGKKCGLHNTGPSADIYVYVYVGGKVGAKVGSICWIVVLTT